MGPEVTHIDLVEANAEWFAILVEVADTAIDRERLPGQPIVVRVLHRLAAGSVRVGTVPQPDDHWTVTVDLVLRGRGCLRPIAGVLALLARGPVGRALEESLASLRDTVRALNHELARVEAEGIDTAACRLLREQLDLALA